jgi:hypothetical protein
MRWLNYLLTAGLLFVGAISLGFLLDFTFRSNEYRFGSEVAGWRYYSARHFVSFVIFEFLLAITGLIVGYRLSSGTKRVLIQAIILFVLVWFAVGTK